MSMLAFLWFISLALLVGMVLYARKRLEILPLSRVIVAPEGFGDFFANEVLRIIGDCYWIFKKLRPHGEMLAEVGMRVIERGHRIFVERVYGRIQVEQGKASSFFLKHIAEYKANQRDGSERFM